MVIGVLVSSTSSMAGIFGRPFVKRFALCYRSVVCLSDCLSVLSVCDVRALWLMTARRTEEAEALSRRVRDAIGPVSK